jgi:hypothetical protein
LVVRLSKVTSLEGLVAGPRLVVGTRVLGEFKRHNGMISPTKMVDFMGFNYEKCW